MRLSIRSAALTRAALLLCLLVAAAAAPTTAGARTGHRIAGLIPDTTAHTTSARVARAATDERTAALRRFHAARAASAALQYFGGPVLHHNRTHVVFWAPAGSGMDYEPGYQPLVAHFLMAVAADSHSTGNVYGLSGQYTDRNGPAAYASTYGGVTETTDPLPANGCTEPSTGPGWSVCLSDAQLQAELEHVVAAQHLPRTGTDIYFLVLPNGFGNCTDGNSTSCALGGGATGYCGYHSEAANGLLYAVIPFNAVPGHCQSDNPRPNGSTADPSLSSLSHEHNEMVTDPDASDAWIDADGEEDGDLCITDFGPPVGGSGQTSWNEVIGGGHWELQEEWSNEDGGCAPRAKPDHVSATVPRRAVAGHALAVSARASAGHGTITGYRWFFGDGATSSRRVATHTFKRAGRYRVVLRVIDSADDWTRVSRTVVVRRR